MTPLTIHSKPVFRAALGLAGSLVFWGWSAPLAAEDGCPAGMMPSGRQQPGTENSGTYVPECVPGSRNNATGEGARPQIEAWRRVLPPLTRPPKGWQPLWVAFRAFKHRDGRQDYILVRGQPTYQAALLAYEAECQRRIAVQLNESCKGWTPSQSAFIALRRHPDDSYGLGYGNSPEEARRLDGGSCDAYEQLARQLRRTDLINLPCATRLIEEHVNAIVPQGKPRKRG